MPPPSTPQPAAADAAPDAAVQAAEPALDRWFTDEVHPHGAQLRSYLRGAFPGVRDIDDVVQESYLRIWQARAAQPIASAKAYLFTVARHLALNLLRRERRSPVDFSGDIAGFGVLENRPGVAEALTEQEKIDLLTDALAALPARTRAILLLHKFDGLAQSGVAARLGLTEKAVEHQIARGVRLCTEFLRTRGHDFF